ncbi:MAG: hypothetical protein A2498_07860 [Lentisphaerae bacterium RIFOXYC12_FULL_60_16]|nr:MAG: hypothetical protein A2498_07860 [Lentisphaerae bacterium RIFOXYC12_FULL_60_16]
MLSRRLIHMVIGCACLLVVSPGATSQEVVVMRRDAPAPVPQAQDIDTLLLIEACRGALANSVEYLLNRCQTNYMTFALPPVTQRPVVGYEERTTYEVRYRSETVQVPIFKNIEEDYDAYFEEYETFDMGGGSSTQARSISKVKARRPVALVNGKPPQGRNIIKVPSKRVVGREQVGTRDEERLKADPNGPIVKTYERVGKPIYGEGNDIFQPGNLGANALVYTALRKCGVPENHPVLDNMMREFERLLNDYGIPDDTWNIAWLAAAFCNNSEERYKLYRDHLVSRLIDGQVKEGPGRGFWGPVCINTELIPVMLTYEQELNKQRQASKKAAAESGKDREKLRKQAEEAENLMEEYVLFYRWVTQQGLRFPPREDITARTNVRKREGINPISVPGLAYPYFNQALADMDNTFYAMFAIREAADHGYLLKDSLRWMMSRNRPVAPPEESDAILARMAAALQARQKPNGQWDECNTHQPITAFQALGLPDLMPQAMLQLQAPVTHLSTVQGYASLLNAGRVVGMAKLMGRFGTVASAAANAQQESARSYLDGQAAGRMFEPYDFFLALTGLHRHQGSEAESRRDLWLRLAYRLVMIQNPNGTWGKENENVAIHSSSWKEFRIKSAEVVHLKQQENLAPDKRTPFDGDAWWKRYAWGDGYSALSRPVINTAMSILFLADGVRLPVSGYVPKAGQQTPPPVLFSRVLTTLKSKDGVEPTYLAVNPEVQAHHLVGLPTVFLTPDADLTSPAVHRALKGYCDHGGTLVAEVPTSDQVSGMQTKILNLVEGGRVGPVPAEVPFLAQFQGAKPRLNGIFNGKGRLTAVILPLDVVKPVDAIQTAYWIVKQNVVDGFFDVDYAWKCEDKEGSLMRIRAVSQLAAEAAVQTPAVQAALTNVPAVKADTGTIAPPSAPAAPFVPGQPKPRKADEKW